MELVAMLAKTMSYDQIVEKIQIDIDEYKEAKLLGKDLEKQKDFLKFTCYLLILNTMEGEAKDIIKDMDKVKTRMNMFEEGTNQN
jgi:UDP-N-acetylmuramate-alanine ligase